MRDANERSALLVATLASFLFPFLGGSSNVAVPAIGAEFHADAATLNWFVTAFIVVSAMLALPFGRLADLHGRKRLFLIGMSLFTVASTLCAAAPSLGLLVAARVAQGIGGSMMAGTAPALLVSIFPPQERGRVLGINTAAVYTGLAAGPVAGGFLVRYGGWRSIFLLSVLVGAFAFFLTRFRLHGEWAEARGERFDGTGAALCAAGIGLLVIGVTLLESSAAGPWLAVAGAASLTAFFLHESRTAQPIFEVGLLRRNRMFALSNLAALISYAATFATGYLLSLYLQVVRGLDPQHAGAVLLTAPVVQAVLSPIAGRVSDRVPPRVVASLGMALCAGALGALAFLRTDTPLALLIGEAAVLGAGFALFSSPNTNAVMSSVDRRLYGVAAATLGTARQVGMTFSMAIVGLLLTLHLGSAPVDHRVAGPLVSAMRLSFGLFAVLCLAGVPASLARGSGESPPGRSAGAPGPGGAGRPDRRPDDPAER
jgi:EmrB/QacA subfamily drug resistance transporter